MPAIKRQGREVNVALFLAIALLTVPISGYSSQEDHEKRVAAILIKKTKDILKEIDRIKPSPKLDSRGRKNDSLKVIQDGKGKSAIKI